MTKIGIAISVYDKFDELKLLIDMIRSWDGDYEIGVCCNHKDGLPAELKSRIDYYIPGRNFPFKKSSTREGTFFWNQDDNYMIRVRAADCVRRACRLMTEHSNCSWIVHVHSDAWFMHEEGLKKFIDDCQNQECLVACRGTGIDTVWKPMGSTSAYGQSDDHFFAFHREFAMGISLWDYRPEDLLMRKYSVHGLLMTIFAVKAGLSNVWYYKKLEDCLNCYEEPLVDNEAKPCVFDPEYGFLHIHRGSFPNGWGKSLQAHFMLRYAGIMHPTSWHDFIQAHYHEGIQFFIRERNAELNLVLKYLLFPKNILKKTRITYKEALIKRATVLTPLQNIKKRLMKWVDSKIFPKRDTLAYYTELNKDIDYDWTRVWNNYE